MRFPQSFLVVSAYFLVMSGAQAAAIYSYVGNNFNQISDPTPPSGTYTGSMSVTGSFEVGSLLSPMSLADISGLVTSYSFNDGRQTLDDSNSDISSFTIEILGDGSVGEWRIDVRSPFSSPAFVGATFQRILTSDTSSLVTQDIGSIQECTAVSGSPASCSSTSLSDVGQVSLTPGTWSVVPIPAAVWLFGSALGLMGWIRHRQTH